MAGHLPYLDIVIKVGLEYVVDTRRLDDDVVQRLPRDHKSPDLPILFFVVVMVSNVLFGSKKS